MNNAFSSFPLRSLSAALFSILCLLAPIADALESTIVIGQTIDLSGPNGDIGRDYVTGIKTYFDEINSGGGINGRKISYVVRDDQGQSLLAVKSITDLIEREKADYLIGGIGDDVTQSVVDAKVFMHSGQLLFAPLTSTRMPGSRVLYWRPAYQQEIIYLCTYFSRLGIKDVGIAYRETPANRVAYNKLVTELRERGLHLTGTAIIKNAAQQDASEAANLAKTKPGFVVLIGDTIDASFFLKEFRKSTPQTYVASTSLINLSTLRELAGEKAVAWTIFSQVVPTQSSGSSEIQMEHLDMMRKFRDESASPMTLEGFAVAKTLTKAIQMAKSPARSALRELVEKNSVIDIGGMSVSAAAKQNQLSNYLDIGFFRKGNTLAF